MRLSYPPRRMTSYARRSFTPGFRRHPAPRHRRVSAVRRVDAVRVASLTKGATAVGPILDV